MVMSSVITAAFLAASTLPSPAVSIRDIIEVTDLSGLDVSPDGKLVAFRTERPALDSNGYAMGWYIVPTDGSAAPRRVADAGAAQYRDAGPVVEQVPVWSPNSNAIYFRALVDGEVQVWRAAADGSDARTITGDPANVRDLTLGADRRTILFHVGATRANLERAEQAAYDGGVLIDESVDMAAQLSRGAIIDGKPASQRLIGNWFDRGDILWKTPLTAKTVALDPRDIPADFEPDPTALPATSNRTDQSVVGTSINWDDKTHLLTASLADGRTIHCDLSPCHAGRAQAAIVLRDHQTVVATIAKVTADQTLYLWTPATGSIRPLAAAKGLLSGDREKDVPCAPAIDALICVEASATAPPMLVRVALADGHVTPLFDPNAALRERPPLPSRALDWLDALGDRHGGELVLPLTPPPPGGYPLVIDYYDCPGFLRGGLGDEVPLLPLASVGIATLCINRAPSDNWHPLQDYDHALSGITAILDRLAAEHLIDPKRVGMTGLSFGSEVALTVAMKTHRLAAFAMSSAQLDPMLYWFNANPKRDYAQSMRRAWGLGAPDATPRAWQRLSPALNVNKVNAPLLLQLPENEARASMQLLTSMQIAQRPVELYAFANEPHVKNQPRHKYAVYERNLDWFRFWLEGYEDPAPPKQAQNAGWRKLAALRNRIAGHDFAKP